MKQVLLIVISFLIISACEKSPSKYIYNKGFIYGTVYSIIYESPDGKDFEDEINKKLKEYTMIFSTYEKESTISKINNNEAVEIGEEFLSCFKRSMEISEITNGAFDITAGPMVNAWGFGPDKKLKMDQAKVDSLTAITGYQKIEMENGEIIKQNPDMKLDMSAIAKGFTSDLIASFLIEKACENYLVEIGGEVVAKGVNERGNTWTVGISKPDEDLMVSNSELQAKIKLPDNALATSGNYRNFYEEDGKKYAHTIDPKTGYPVQHSLLSATVLAKDCMTADAFATAFMVMGHETGIELARSIPEIEVLFIYSDERGNNQIYMSEGFEEFVVN